MSRMIKESSLTWVLMSYLSKRNFKRDSHLQLLSKTPMINFSEKLPNFNQDNIEKIF